MKKIDKPKFEVVQELGWEISVYPLDFIAGKGVIGRILAFILIFLWCLPLLGFFTFLAFLFWIFEKK